MMGMLSAQQPVQVQSEAMLKDGYEDSHDSNKENVEPEEATFFTPPSSPTQMARAAPEDDPLSPFAKGFSDIGESKVLERKPMAMPLQGQNALSRIRNSFRVRQLSFNDWCFETPALSGSPRKSESSASQASAISQIDLHPSGVQNADVSWVPKPSAMQPTLHLLHKPFKAAIDDHDMLIADESDLLSCDESLSCLQSFDYAMPSTKRRRSLS